MTTVSTDADLRAWIALHGLAGQENNERVVPAYEDRGHTIPATKVIDSTTITGTDGATITLRRHVPPIGEGQFGPEDPTTYEQVGYTPPKEKPGQRTPEQTRIDVATATKEEQANALAQREQDERDWNQTHVADGGSGLPETHLERSVRVAKERDQQRQQQQLEIQQAAEARQTAAQEAQVRESAATRAEQAREHDITAGLTQQQITETARHNQAAENKPEFLPANTNAPYNVRYNPATGQTENIANPNYDAIKAAAEEKRAEIATQIASRNMDLEEAKAAYSQWFDTNVKTPMMMAQEQRARAEERRQALDAEERRRQFAADFGLRKATLGQQAASTAIQAEESLLPYRAGPNEAADMSSAITGLAAGGIVGGPSAAAGVHFQPSDFEFNAPNFKKIAADATKAVLSHLTDYRPSDQAFDVADYSGIPGVNLSGAPAMPGVGGYSYPTSTSLPAPSAGAGAPPE
jgi:hypothetical protein